MSWQFQRHAWSTSYLLDCEEWNDNVAAFVGETDGNLNEHNFENRMLALPVSESRGAAGVGYASDGIGVQTSVAVFGSGFLAGGRVLAQSEAWKTVGTELPFVSRGGKVCVIISFQMGMQVTLTLQSGLNFCVGLDGAPVMSSLLGTGDQGNDFLDGGAGGSVPVYSFGTSPSFRARHTAHQVTAVFEVSPGEHTVTLLYRNLFAVSACVQNMDNCEIIVLDGWC